jgi:hypothetical protein
MQTNGEPTLHDSTLDPKCDSTASPARPPVGRFRVESDMLGPVRRWLEGHSLDVRSEFRSPWGYCDVVGVEWNAERVQHRLALQQIQPIAAVSRLWILSRIPDETTGRSRSMKVLCREASELLPDLDATAEVEELRKAHYVTFPRAGFVQKINGWLPIHRSIVAIELKLSRVAEATAQAQSNLGFATTSYVALPQEVACEVSRDRRGAALRAHGLGLLSVAERDCDVLIAPRRGEPRSENLIELSAVERFWRRRATGN